MLPLRTIGIIAVLWIPLIMGRHLAEPQSEESEETTDYEFYKMFVNACLTHKEYLYACIPTIGNSAECFDKWNRELIMEDCVGNAKDCPSSSCRARAMSPDLDVLFCCPLVKRKPEVETNKTPKGKKMP